ncbi:MAG: hypothetical protein M1539_00600 [Actinobacteria bacterium]|nr:hypothetical protein [Actinomycetota bacterium]MCL5882477.1 hypothetical protein [Actinomycetota bacterium]
MTDIPKWKSTAAIALIVLGCLVATCAVAVVWLNQVVVDTDKYVDTVAPLSEDPAIKDAVARSATDQLFARANAEQLTREALPDRADFLAAPIVEATKAFVEEQLRNQLDSPAFSNIWKEANRKAHDLVLQVVLGREGTISSSGGKVSLDLSNLLDNIKSQLSIRGINIFQNVSLGDSGIQFTIFESQSITQAQSALNLLDKLAYWLPVIALVFLAVAVWLSANRAAAVFRVGLGVAAGMVLLLVVLAYVRSRYLDAVGSAGTVDVPAATSFFDIIAGSLKTSVKSAFAGSLLVAFIGFTLGPAGAWITRQRTTLRAVGVVLALLALVLIDQPSLSQALLITVILLAYLGILEFLARKAA